MYKGQSKYNSTEPPAAPRNLALAIGKGLTLRGFVVGQYPELVAEYHSRAPQWLAEGRLRSDETFRDGLDAAPQAFMDLLDGANMGKMLVRL